MIPTMRAVAPMLMLLCASSVAQAQHSAAPQAVHGAAAGTSPAHAESKPADTHATKPASPDKGHAAAPAQKAALAKTPPVTTAEQAVAQVMKALDREFGPPSSPSAGTPRRKTPVAPRAAKIAVSWKMQLVWPEAEPPNDPVRVRWPEPVLDSVPLRFTYVSLPK